MNKISVIVPTKNRAKNLYSCLCSLSKQTIKPYQVVIADNASTDDTKHIVQKFKKLLNIKYVYEEKAGVSSARNTALKTSTGNIIAFLDDDCVAHKNWIKEIIKNSHYLSKYFLLGKNLNKNFKNTPSNYIYFVSISSLIANTRYENGKKIIRNYLDTKNAVINRKQYNQLKPLFNEKFNEVHSTTEDIDLGIRLNNIGYSGLLISDIKVYHSHVKNILPCIKKRFFAGRSLLKNKKIINETIRNSSKSSRNIEKIFSTSDLEKIVKFKKKKYKRYTALLIKSYSKDISLRKKIILYFMFISDSFILKYGILYQKVIDKLGK